MSALPVEASPVWKITKEQMGNPEWRLDNLYWVENEDGEVVRFVRRDFQRALWEERHQRNTILKARQLGFSTFIALMFLDSCLFRKNTAAGIVDLTLDDAQAKLSKIKFAYDRLPQLLRGTIRLDKANQSELVFSNGSSISVGTSHRGGTLQLLHVSEYGKISSGSPDVAREIKTGAFPAVHKAGRIFVESTAHGKGGEFYEMVQRAEALQKQGAILTELDFKLHFFGWHKHRGYRIQNNLVTVPAALHAYFDELQAKHGIRLDANQKAWYSKQYDSYGPDEMNSEYPSIPEEAFASSLKGAFWKAEMTKARIERRVGHPVPHDPSRPVNTFWDIGLDATAIVFHQTDGVRHRVIDYWEEVGASIHSGISVLQEKARDRRFVYGQHIGPHDLEHRVWVAKAQTRKDIAAEFGVKFSVVERVDDKAESVEAGRRMLNLTWIDAEHCGRFVDVCDNYSKTWNEKMAMYTAVPLHNEWSHGADAWQQGAMHLAPQKPKVDKPKREPVRGTQWSG